MKKKWTILLLVMFGLTSMFLTSCSDDDDDDDSNLTTMNAADVIAYMDANNLTSTAILTDWIKSADAVNTTMTDTLADGSLDTTNDYYIMDLRSAELYGKGHIPGAHNVSLADVITHADANVPDAQTIALVCYTGQSACHGVVGLRLAGYNAFSIKWGMAGWHTDIDDLGDGDLTTATDLKFDYWSAACAQLDHVNWVAAPGDAALPTTTYDLPSVSYTGDTEEAILKARAQFVVENFHKVGGSTVLDAPATYFINNYWAAGDVTTYGNIVGAKRINPLDLNLINPDLPVVTYCWTGQTSSMITAYLTAIGYDAWSLGNGSNSMIYDDLLGHKWDASLIVDLPLEGTLAK